MKQTIYIITCVESNGEETWVNSLVACSESAAVRKMVQWFESDVAEFLYDSSGASLERDTNDPDHYSYSWLEHSWDYHIQETEIDVEVNISSVTIK